MYSVYKHTSPSGKVYLERLIEIPGLNTVVSQVPVWEGRKPQVVFIGSM